MLAVVDRFAPSGELRLLPFLGVVLLAGALLDRGNGFYATGLAAILVAYLMPPSHSLAVGSAQDAWDLTIFVLLGIAISLVVEALHVGLVEVSLEHRAVLAAGRDRGVLMEELAHRTRNDLANLATLLGLQARSAGGETAAALTAAADRVQAVARVHRTLDLSGDRVVVDSKAYIDELCEDLRRLHAATRPLHISWRAESHQLALNKAVPLGLVLNEAVTNALKHAFPGDRRGSIEIGFVRANHHYELTVADDGAGLPARSRDTGLGRRLIGLLAAQLGGEASIEPRPEGGTLVRVIIPQQPKRT